MNRFNNNNNFQRRTGGGFGGSRRPSFGGSRGGARGGSTRVMKYFDPSQIIRSVAPAQDRKVVEVVNSFVDFGLEPKLERAVAEKGYIKPTPIQDQTIPPIMAGKDLIGVANTGTGKTAAFLLPLINKVIKDPNQYVLIVAPIRELAVQIQNELREFTKGMGIFSVLCIGGVDIGRQKRDLTRPLNFVIGTPGRLKDLSETGFLPLQEFQSVVLDEVDHMLDIGFLRDVEYLVGELNDTRQSLFFSATVDAKSRDILRKFVQNPVSISVKTGDTASNVHQEVVRIQNNGSKIDQLHDMLLNKEFEKVLIFGRTKHGVQRLSEELVIRGFKAEAIHGDKKQSQRQRALDRFKSNLTTILLATDVAARGLDIPNVSHVINYELPESHETYIHRIGRTGRAEKSGKAITFVN